MGRLIGAKILSKITMGNAINEANFMLFLLAYTFGNTSPKSKIKKVTKTTSTTNFRMGAAIVEKSLSSENEKSTTMAMCKKLFATKIVANNFLGLDNKFSTALDWLGY